MTARRLRPEQQRDADAEHRPVGVPVAERIAEPRAAAERICNIEYMWQQSAAEAEQGDQGRSNC